MARRGRLWQLARWAATAACGAATAAIFILLWKPFFSMPEDQDPVAMGYGIVPLTWTVAATLAVSGGWAVSSIFAPRVALGLAMLLLAGMTGFIVWRLYPHARQSTPPIDLLAWIAGSLAPPLMFGWLMGFNGQKVAPEAVP
jgi:hypothetical protein